MSLLRPILARHKPAIKPELNDKRLDPDSWFRFLSFDDFIVGLSGVGVVLRAGWTPKGTNMYIVHGFVETWTTLVAVSVFCSLSRLSVFSKTQITVLEVILI